MAQDTLNVTLLTTQDVARLAAVATVTVRLWERTGKLPAIRTLGGMRLFSRVDVDRVIAARAADPATRRHRIL